MLCSEKEDNSTHFVLNQPEAGIAQEFDEFGVKFVVCVPGPSCKLHGRIEVGKHVDFAGRVLGKWVKLAPRII